MEACEYVGCKHGVSRDSRVFHSGVPSILKDGREG